MFFDPWAQPDYDPGAIPAEAPVPEDVFRKVSSLWLTGVAVITTRREDGACLGLTMSAVTPLSLSPPLYMICVANRSQTLSGVRESGRFCINVLSEDQEAVCRIFGSKSPDKFDRVRWSGTSDEPPEIEGALARLQCRVRSFSPHGDHVAVTGQVQRASLGSGRPLAYFAREFGRLELGATAPPSLTAGVNP